MARRGKREGVTSRRASEESLGMKTLTHLPMNLSKSHPGFIRGIPNITKEPLPTPHCYSVLGLGWENPHLWRIF